MDLITINRLSLSIATITLVALLSACSATSDINTVPQSGASTADDNAAGNTTPDNDSGAAQDAGNTQDSGQSVDSGSTTSDNDEGTAGQSASDATLVANASSIPCDAAPDVFRDTMLAMVNNSRQADRQCGNSDAPATGTVQWSIQLATAATDHANDMVDANFFSHTGSDGLSVADRAETAGYNWRAIGENIAAGQRDIAEVHQGWLDSAGHCRNIMNSSYTEIGAACVDSDATDFGKYWVVVFGDQR